MPNDLVSVTLDSAWTFPAPLATLAQSTPASPLATGSGPEAGSTTTTTPGTPSTGAPAGGGAGPSQPQGLGPIIWLLPLLLLFFIFMSGGAQRKEKKRMAKLLSDLKKQDRVLTIGGMIGTVVEVRDDEVVLKIDENANTRARFTKNAIQQVLRSSDASPAASTLPSETKVEVKAGRGDKATV
jgi:preprotein translocase subunit YajC